MNLCASKSLSFVAILLITLLHVNIVHVEAVYNVQVRGYSYSNPSDRCASCTVPSSPTGRGCCDNPSNVNTCTNEERCDTTFFYCLRSLSSPMPLSGLSYCSVTSQGVFSTFSQMDSSVVDFSQDTVLGLRNPLQLEGIGNAYTAGVTLYIWVIDRDNSDGLNFSPDDDTIDEFFINVTNGINIETARTRYFGQHGIAQMELSIVVTCAEFYYGSMCENLNDCELNSVNCSGRGRCEDNVNAFNCVCDPGYTGQLCNEIDYCARNNVSCGENGACVNTQNVDSPTMCTCEAGYSGTRCNQRQGVVSNLVIIIASVGGGLILILVVSLTIVLLVICARKVPRPQPKKANIAQAQRHDKQQRSRPTSGTSQQGLYSQFRWSRFETTSATSPPTTTPSAYEHSRNSIMNPDDFGYNAAPQTFKPPRQQQTGAPGSSSKQVAGAVPGSSRKSEAVKSKIEEETHKEQSEEEEAHVTDI